MDNLDHETPAEDLEALREICAKAHWTRVAIEVGCWAGATTYFLSDRFTTVYAVDHWQGSERLTDIANNVGNEVVFETFCRNMGQRLISTVVPLRGLSMFWSSVWPECRKADLVFIDASHDYASVKADIAAWWPHVKAGGILCGHDYNTHGGVQKAVDDFGKDGVIANVWWRKKH